jgi:hypothetical protein
MTKGRKVPPQAPQPPAYLRKLLAAAELAAQPGTLKHIEVRHDDWCDLLNGRGKCNCNPAVHAGPAIDKKHNERGQG